MGRGMCTGTIFFDRKAIFFGLQVARGSLVASSNAGAPASPKDLVSSLQAVRGGSAANREPKFSS